MWNAATDNKGVTKYRIVRDGRLLGMTALLAYTDDTVQMGAVYTYTVKAAGCSGQRFPRQQCRYVSPDGICETTQLYYQQHVESSDE